ncbi:MAG: sigma-54-dependent transcriptional regulator [Dehalococcoidia bacterium]
MTGGRVLVVDDEESILISLKRILEDEGFTVTTVEDGETALERMERHDFDLVMLDVWLPGMDGLQTLSHMKESWRDIPVIMISGHGTIETAVTATKLGAYDFIEKPLSLEKMVLCVEHALKQKELEEENQALRQKVEKRYRMVGLSPSMDRLRQLIALAAPSNGRVLICGENGTGKELVARAIHRQSHRAEGPFVEVNCAAIPDELIESELFGHEKGAFTGASTLRRGKFELADKGTLFLDEVGDMSLKTQSKVLRVLEEKAFQRVGGTQVIHTDARVIAASNKDLTEEIKGGNFREDLFYRLNVIPIFVPPLMERTQDIPLLIEYFLQELSLENGRKPKTMDADAVGALCAYHWPGNVRELKNIIERLVIMISSDTIGVEDLPPPMRYHKAPEPRFDFDHGSLREARSAFEREYIKRLLERNHWNISKTAEELKIGRNNLYNKMRAYDLDQERQSG